MVYLRSLLSQRVRGVVASTNDWVLSLPIDDIGTNGSP